MIQLPCPECEYLPPGDPCPLCEGTGYLLAPPDFAEVVAAVLMFAFVFAGCALFAWWVLYG